MWVAVFSPAFSAITVKWNWPQKQTRSVPHLSPRPTLVRPGDGFFCCSVCLLVWSGAHGYPAWSMERTSVWEWKNKTKGREWKWWGWMTHKTSPWGDERPAEKLQGKAAQQIHTNSGIRPTKTYYCLRSYKRCYFWQKSHIAFPHVSNTVSSPFYWIDHMHYLKKNHRASLELNVIVKRLCYK